MEPQVIIYNGDEEEEIVLFLDHAFDGWPGKELSCNSIDHWRWKYLENHLGLHIIVYCKVNSRIVGCDHSLFKWVKIGENDILMGLGADSGTHKEYRGQGIYKKLAAVKKERSREMGVNITYWSTNNPIFIDYAKKMNRPKLPYNLTNMTKIINLKEHFGQNLVSRKGLEKIRYQLLSKTNFTEHLFDQNRYEIFQVDFFNEETDFFWNKIKKDYDFIIERNQRYLNWRYSDSRAGNYLIFIIVEKEKMVGYMVLDGGAGNIHELLTFQDNTDALDIMIQTAIAYYEKAGVCKVNCWGIENTLLTKKLGSYGFVSNKRSVGHVYFTNEARSLLNELKKAPPDKIYFTLGDIDS
jgi:GNAT superfamily N-acetyltransferase